MSGCHGGSDYSACRVNYDYLENAAEERTAGIPSQLYAEEGLLP